MSEIDLKNIDPKLVDAVTKALAEKYHINLNQKPADTPTDLISRVSGMFEEYNKLQELKLKKALDESAKEREARDKKMIEDAKMAQDIEVERAMRKALGLDTDRPVYMSDLVTALRKAGLETANTDKRTPAPEDKTTPDGNAPIVKSAFDKYEEESAGGKK